MEIGQGQGGLALLPGETVVTSRNEPAPSCCLGPGGSSWGRSQHVHFSGEAEVQGSSPGCGVLEGDRVAVNRSTKKGFHDTPECGGAEKGWIHHAVLSASP